MAVADTEKVTLHLQHLNLMKRTKNFRSLITISQNKTTSDISSKNIELAITHVLRAQQLVGRTRCGWKAPLQMLVGCEDLRGLRCLF